MEIIEGLIAVLVPFFICVCRRDDRWFVIVYGAAPTPENLKGVIARHDEDTLEGAKLSASNFMMDKWHEVFDPIDGKADLPWESLVCNPRVS